MVRVTIPGKNGSQRNRQRGNMRNRIEIVSAIAVTDPKTFLTSSFETGIVTLAFCPKRVDTLKVEAVPVNGKPVIVRNGFVFGAPPVFLAIVPVLVAARTFAGFRVSEWAAVFLTQAAFASRLSVLSHGKAGFTDRIAGSKVHCFPGVAFVQRDDRFAVVDVPNRVVNVLGVIPFVADEGAFLYGDHFIRTLQYGFDHGRVCNIGRCGQLIDRQTGDAVHKDMILVSPVEFVVSFVVLVGGAMDAEGAARVALRVVFIRIFVLCKGFRVILRRVCQNGRGVQSDERGVHHAEFVKDPDQGSLDLFQDAIVQILDKAFKRPVGRQWLCDIETAVISDQQIILQIIQKIGNVDKALAFHDDECTEQGFLREAGTTCFCAGQFKVKRTEQLVVERCDTL